MSRKRLLLFAVIGLLAGFFSGLFGVGGGIVMVPLMVGLLGMPQRLASGTSLAAILPTAVAGLIGYAISDNVDWIAGACLAVGAVAGSLIGTWLLHIIPQRALRWGFIVFLVAVAVRMFFLVPDRSADLEFTPLIIVGLIAVGLVVGILSGLLGIGGGVVVVPTLMILFGVGDLAAKGASLLMMIPTALTGTISNAVRKNVDLKAALMVGSLAIPASFGGVALAVVMPGQLANMLFALLMLYSIGQLLYKALRERGTPQTE